MGGGGGCYWLHAALQRCQCHWAHPRAGGKRHSQKTLRTQWDWTKGHTANQQWIWQIWTRRNWRHAHVFMVHTIAHACMHANTLLNTRSDQTLQLTVSSSWQNMDVTHWNGILQSQQCLSHHSARQNRKYKRTLSVTKGWVNHELTLPREHHYLCMRCQTQWVKTGIVRCAATRIFLPLFLSKCLNLQYVPVIHVPSDLLLFLWSGSLAD